MGNPTQASYAFWKAIEKEINDQYFNVVQIIEEFHKMKQAYVAIAKGQCSVTDINERILAKILAQLFEGGTGIQHTLIDSTLKSLSGNRKGGKISRKEFSKKRKISDGSTFLVCLPAPNSSYAITTKVEKPKGERKQISGHASAPEKSLHGVSTDNTAHPELYAYLENELGSRANIVALTFGETESPDFRASPCVHRSVRRKTDHLRHQTKVERSVKRKAKQSRDETKVERSVKRKTEHSRDETKVESKQTPRHASAPANSFHGVSTTNTAYPDLFAYLENEFGSRFNSIALTFGEIESLDFRSSPCLPRSVGRKTEHSRDGTDNYLKASPSFFQRKSFEPSVQRDPILAEANSPAEMSQDEMSRDEEGETSHGRNENALQNICGGKIPSCFSYREKVTIAKSVLEFIMNMSTQENHQMLSLDAELGKHSSLWVYIQKQIQIQTKNEYTVERVLEEFKALKEKYLQSKFDQPKSSTSSKCRAGITISNIFSSAVQTEATAGCLPSLELDSMNVTTVESLIQKGLSTPSNSNSRLPETQKRFSKVVANGGAVKSIEKAQDKLIVEPSSKEGVVETLKLVQNSLNLDANENIQNVAQTQGNLNVKHDGHLTEEQIREDDLSAILDSSTIKENNAYDISKELAEACGSCVFPNSKPSSNLEHTKEINKKSNAILQRIFIEFDKRYEILLCTIVEIFRKNMLEFQTSSSKSNLTGTLQEDLVPSIDIPLDNISKDFNPVELERKKLKLKQELYAIELEEIRMGLAIAKSITLDG